MATTSLKLPCCSHCGKDVQNVQLQKGEFFCRYKAMPCGCILKVHSHEVLPTLQAELDSQVLLQQLPAQKLQQLAQHVYGADVAVHVDYGGRRSSHMLKVQPQGDDYVIHNSWGQETPPAVLSAEQLNKLLNNSWYPPEKPVSEFGKAYATIDDILQEEMQAATPPAATQAPWVTSEQYKQNWAEQIKKKLAAAKKYSSPPSPLPSATAQQELPDKNATLEPTTVAAPSGKVPEGLTKVPGTEPSVAADDLLFRRHHRVIQRRKQEGTQAQLE